MKAIKSLYLFLVSASILAFTSCQDSQLTENPTTPIKPSSRAGHNNGYFEWYNLEEINMRISSSGTINIPVPWSSGSSASSNLPSHWIDPYAGTPQSIYSRENGWELVYSNIHEPIAKKYFALYNKPTGIIRFFMYAYSTSAQEGTSSSFWGIKAEGSTALFNFLGNIATPLTDVQENPAYVTSTPGVLYAGEFQCKGYQENQWYGFEMECAYDPNIADNTNFRLNGWATNEITYTGTASTTGNINGTITSNSANTGTNIDLSNMFSTNNNVTIKSENGSAIDQVAINIENGIKNNDSFSKSLWNNIKSNISLSGDGIKKGINSLLSSKSSSAIKIASGLFKSIFGSSTPAISKVELSVNTETSFNIKSSQSVVGYGGMAPFPIAGYSTISSNNPLYNKPLGAWSLKKAPQIRIELYVYHGQDGIGYGTYDIDYNIEGKVSDYICFNPEISKEFNIEESRFEILSNRYCDIPPYCEATIYPRDLAQIIPSKAYGKIENINYYNLGTYIAAAGAPIVNWEYPISHCGAPLSLPSVGPTKRLLVKVSFYLVNKSNGMKYYHYKYFYPEFSCINIYE